MSEIHDHILTLDTETTGFFHDGGDRIVEIGIVELINRKPTGRRYHVYLDPEMDVPEEAYAVHGLSRDDLVKLSNGRTFADQAQELMDFIGTTPIVAHNATFDISFLDAELSRCGMKGVKERGIEVVDSLRLANVMYPGQANNLNALYKRLFGKMPEDRELHGALLDAFLLAEIYQAMTIKQGGLEIDRKSLINTEMTLKPRRLNIEPGDLITAIITDEDRQLNARMNERIAKEYKQAPRTDSLSL